ncbi:SAV_6107 family HEPN domain-containing protein [Corynebacterium tapiri]|uniref:SAV-6107-like HEPN domain-containing protein n=1 Tax=Corynebacterium tapiri TaxID=1448266 RepID=A0A5C4U6M2_9CORY|nr:SAV_6107 family HEPN domain-containing protein [Corynebacterium tapiri]TNL99407.1 hypothetical protein FHE74_03395 [Corynebacterium tapiri]
MGDIISATTTATEAKSARFLSSASLLLDQAERCAEAGEWGLALENAYQAALRTAGARTSADPAIKRRKRLPTSAWARLQLMGGDAQRWAVELSGYSRLRSRVLSGIEPDPDPGRVRELIDLARAFYDSTLLGDDELLAA